MLPEDRLWPGVLDPVASEIVENRLRQEGISLAKGSDLNGFVVKEGRLAGVTTSAGEELTADLLIVASRRVPAMEFLSGSGLAGASGIPVDERLRTKQENIFAAGDVAMPPAAEFMDSPVPHTGWLNAWEQGSVAGINMCGGEAVYCGYPALRTRVVDLDLVCLGLSDADPVTVREETGDYPFEELPYIYKKIVYRGRKVSGALFLGDASEAGRVGQWIRRGVDEKQCDRAVLDQMFQSRITSIQSIGALCPVCKYQMQLDDSCRDGDAVSCPACGVEFRLERMPNGVFRAGFPATP
jgi:NADPH-dependent 2,4-dienoyl-CoA reductase/sulfur reductase-like enzyme